MSSTVTRVFETASGNSVTLNGTGLTIAEIADVAVGARIQLTDDPAALQAIEASSQFIADAVARNTPIYGVTTCFGGMADRVVPKDTAAELQRNLIWSHKAAVGARLPNEDVRAGMLLRANSLVQGISGVRLKLLQRFEIFLNANVTPHVYEFGSIGASGDLVPLAYIAGCLTGRDAAYKVDFDGEEMDALTALDRLGLEPLPLEAKEGLALINGTSVMAGVAANCVYRMSNLMALTMGAHGLMMQGLHASNQSFHPFIHKHKPHPGQMWAAEQTMALLDGSRMIRDETHGNTSHREGKLIQDRYSIRCLPQYLGPLVDGFWQVAREIEVEANSVTDNPLIDVENEATYHCGNFLGQYVGVGMDRLRHMVGLAAKHLDVQIAQLVAPEFSHGLTPSLVGNPAREVATGLKALQLTANSIMPMLLFYGRSLVDHFPTHAEQFNQNVNSLGYSAANLARRSLDVFEQYLALSLIFGTQAVDLRTHLDEGHYDARKTLSPATLPLYEAVKRVTGRPASQTKPFVWNDQEQFLDEHIAAILGDIRSGGEVLASVGEIAASLRNY
jgi:phenylalanine ammonia-lyase